jgi:hypothetical protein
LLDKLGVAGLPSSELSNSQLVGEDAALVAASWDMSPNGQYAR